MTKAEQLAKLEELKALLSQAEDLTDTDLKVALEDIEESEVYFDPRLEVDGMFGIYYLEDAITRKTVAGDKKIDGFVVTIFHFYPGTMHEPPDMDEADAYASDNLASVVKWVMMKHYEIVLDGALQSIAESALAEELSDQPRDNMQEFLGKGITS